MNVKYRELINSLIDNNQLNSPHCKRNNTRIQ